MIGRMVVDESTEFGQRVAAHLREDVVVWLTTVSAKGAPLPTPVWFLWDGADGLRIQSLPTARRVAHLAGNAAVALNFAGDGEGGDIVVLTGTARAGGEDAGPVPSAYDDKYRTRMEGMGVTPEQFATRYSEPVVVTLTHVSGH
jgi:PPOX class probable F420-dependent enzyme